MVLQTSITLEEPRILSCGIRIYWKRCEEAPEVGKQSDDSSISVNESDTSNQDTLKYFNLWRYKHLNINVLAKVSLIFNHC